MKLIKINKIPAYYMGRIGEDILINVENIHPFEYPHEFYERITRIIEKIPRDKINVYINFSKQYGYLKISKIEFSKETNNFLFSTEKEVPFEELPQKIKSLIKKNENVITVSS